MPKGFDPNASFRNPVKPRDEEPSILVRCNLLETLISVWEDDGSTRWGVIEDLKAEVASARKAQEAHRRG